MSNYFNAVLDQLGLEHADTVPNADQWATIRDAMFCQPAPVSQMQAILEKQNKALEAAVRDAQAAAKTKADFLANMSHEIRTPMNGIVGMTELLLETKLSEEQKDYVDTIQSSGDALLTIINDILDFSKIDAGKLEIESIDFDLRRTTEEAVDILAKTAHEKGLKITALIGGDIPQMVCGDPGRLRQVLTNLISNAIKFTNEGEVIINVSRNQISSSKSMIRFEVRDTGIGISASQQERLFHAFTQADTSTTRKYGGTGLGLSICRRLVGMMGGEISVESEEGNGSTFSFTVEVNTCEESLHDDDRLIGAVGARRVLVVDGHLTTQKVLQQQLSDWGVEVECARTGTEALLMLEQASYDNKVYDVCLIDVDLADMSGIDFARKLMADERFDSMRRIVMTVIGQRGDSRLAKEVGASAYLTKPIRRAHLIECIRTVSATRNSIPIQYPTDTSAFITRHSIEDKLFQSKPRLLVVDDTAVNQTLAVRHLEKLGFGVDIASNGQEALDAHLAHRYPIILMDCQMPIMDGYTATKKIRELEGDGPKAIIIAMTAHALQSDREYCLSVGMDDHLSLQRQIQQLNQRVYQKVSIVLLKLLQEQWQNI
jgi:signal transduction histidine kinase/CheY-like chemotaxis protein